jgi:hypothetical protein
MNPIHLINDLWYWTYSIIVGWGASFTILITLNVLLVLRLVRLNRKVITLESRIVTAEREINLAISKIK